MINKVSRLINYLSALCVFTLILFISDISFSAQEAEIVDKTAEFFLYRCAGCHTVSGGNKTGPDLINSIKWNDPDLKAAIKRMEKNSGAMTDDEIIQLMEFLRDLSVSERIEKQKKRVEESFRTSLPPASFEMGEKLFRGQVSFSHGGISCIACHRFVNEGGVLGPDLTNLKDKLSGVALHSAIENSSFKLMRPIYESHKITTEEALHLSEFLSHPQKNDQRMEWTITEVFGFGCVGFCGFFGLVWLMNKNRKGRTRENLILKSKRKNFS